MIQWGLSALNVLTEAPGSVPSTHMAAHKDLKLQLQGIRCPSLASMMYTWYAYTQAGKTFSHIEQI